MKPLTICLILSAICYALAILLIISRYKHNIKLGTVLKITASVFFLAVGVYSVSVSENYSVGLLLMTVGLFFGLVGDVLLQLKNVFKEKFAFFMALGTFGFLLGHFSYIAGIITRYSFHPVIFVWSVAATVAMYFNLKRYDLSKFKALKWFGLFYYFCLHTFLAMAVRSAIAFPSPSSIILACGAFFFAVSDTILAEYYFGKSHALYLTALNLATYYLGQILIALSITLF